MAVNHQTIAETILDIADETGQRFVGELERDRDAVGRDPTPSIRQMPEEHEEANIDPPQVGDGQGDRQ